MRRNIPLLLAAAFVALTVSACEGPLGPAGPIGPEGPAGPAGPQGPAGADAMNTCVQCHGHDTNLQAIEWQYAASAHYETVYWDREGACMACHNHQGFITTAVNGQQLPPFFNNPSPIGCRTCHEVHTTFTEGDYAFTTTAPVNLTVGGTADLGGAGNLCANCHQARMPNPMPTINGSPITISAGGAGRYGPHYGTQGNVMAATGAFHFPGLVIPTSPNAHGQAGCETCHMTRPVGAQAGGHTFNLRYGQNGNTELIRACTQCHFHANATSFNDREGQAYTKALLTELRQLLIEAGIYNVNTGYAVAGTHDANVAAAYHNYKMFYYDGSYGVHNPRYAETVLYNTIQMLKAR
jgi:hypothetical protein